MNTIRADEIVIEGDEDGYALIVTDADTGERVRVNVQDIVFDFYAAVQADIRPYVLEAEDARRSVPVQSMHDGFGYELDDPKHPTYHDRMVGDV